jgi:hypothetical protein
LQLLAVNGVVIPVQTVVYLVAITLMDAPGDWARVRAVLEAQLAPILRTTWTYFPVLQLLMFKFVPADLWLPIFYLIGYLYGVVINLRTKREATPLP